MNKPLKKLTLFSHNLHSRGGLFFIACISLLLSLNVQSEVAEKTSPPKPSERWYQIEVLIFEQSQNSSGIGESWPNDISLSYPINFTTLKTQKEAKEENLLKRNPSLIETPFVLLNKEQKLFLKIKQGLRWRKQRVFFHGVWRQPFIQHSKETPIAILIKGGQEFNQHHELEGSISFKLTRYMHINSNLWLSTFSYNIGQQIPWPELPTPPNAIVIEPTLTEDTGNKITSFSDDYYKANYKTNFNSDLNASFNTNHYNITQLESDKTVNNLLEKKYIIDNISTMRQSRRMKRNELHYIDHPKIGLLVRFSPYQPLSLDIEENNGAENTQETPNTKHQTPNTKHQTPKH